MLGVMLWLQYSTPVEERRDSMALYNKMTLASLQDMTPGVRVNNGIYSQTCVSGHLY